MGALDAVICAAVAVPIAAAFYWLLEQALDSFFFVVGTVVGSPLM